MREPKCPSYCVIHPHRWRKARRTFLLILAALAVAAAMVGIALRMDYVDRRDRQEFIDRCENQGGKIVDLGRESDLYCQIGRLTIKYGDR